MDVSFKRVNIVNKKLENANKEKDDLNTKLNNAIKEKDEFNKNKIL